MQTQPHIEPDAKISDLVGRLRNDSKRLVSGEVRLAKLEVKESAKLAARGTLWLALAFGVGTVGLVALTIFLATLIGRLVGGHMYAGALIAGALEVIVGLWLIKRGTSTLKEPPYTLKETRAELRETAAFLAHPQHHGRAD